jgi:hypothetical protein
MMDVSPFWRTLNASDLYIARSCENLRQTERGGGLLS